MEFKVIYEPIVNELDEVEKKLKNVVFELPGNSMQEIMKYFFQIPGKRLRPILVFLSAGTVNPELSKSTDESLIQLALALELIHNASLIHDDIIDGDILRRNQETLNKVYGRKIAVLAGDVVFAHAFSILARSLPDKFQRAVIELTENMCAAEIDQAKFTMPDKEMYLNIIKGKTASFMGTCCRLGAELQGVSEEELTCLEEYGLYLGMTYQIMDDYMDKDVEAINNVTLDDAYFYAGKAKEALSQFADSPYKESLINMIEYILGFSKGEVKNA